MCSLLSHPTLQTIFPPNSFTPHYVSKTYIPTLYKYPKVFYLTCPSSSPVSSQYPLSANISSLDLQTLLFPQRRTMPQPLLGIWPRLPQFEFNKIDKVRRNISGLAVGSSPGSLLSLMAFHVQLSYQVLPGSGASSTNCTSPQLPGNSQTTIRQ